MRLSPPAVAGGRPALRPRRQQRLFRCVARQTVRTGGEVGGVQQQQTEEEDQKLQQQLEGQGLPGQPPQQQKQERDLLSVQQLQALTELHREDAYACGVVASAAELAERLGTSLQDGLCEDEVGEGGGERARLAHLLTPPLCMSELPACGCRHVLRAAGCAGAAGAAIRPQRHAPAPGGDLLGAAARGAAGAATGDGKVEVCSCGVTKSTGL